MKNNHGQRKKDVSSLLGEHLETRSKSGEDNTRERGMPVIADNHADTFKIK